MLDEEAALVRLERCEDPIVRSHHWFRGPGGDPRIRVELELEDYVLEVRFPPHFPRGCPSIRPVPYERRIGYHQFLASGVLCLELGPDNWHPLHTVAEMVQSAWRLIAYNLINEVKPIEIPSRDCASLGRRVSLARGVLLRSQALDDRIAATAGHGDFRFIVPIRGRVRVIPVEFPIGTPLPRIPAFAGETEFDGIYAVLAQNAPPSAPPEVEKFIGFVAEHAGVAVERKPLGCVLLRWPSRVRGYLILNETLLELEDVPMDFSPGTRMPDALHDVLPKVKVGIVGLGSLGGKVAVSLARMGVSRFILLDGDVLLAPNVCRHVARLQDIGEAKVDIIKALIRDVAAVEPEVIAYAADLQEAMDPDVHARIMERLGTVDVLIDTTANPHVFCCLANLASDRRRPMAWAEVFAGGFAGLVGSAHPDDGPCPQCVRSAFQATASNWPAAPVAPSVDAYGGGDDAAMIATDADVAHIAAVLTNRVVDLVARRDQQVDDVVVVGIRTGWIFDAPMQSRTVRVRRDDWCCASCWTSPTDADPDSIARARALFVEDDDGNDSPAA